LAELRTFLAFLTGLWGMLTGLSLLFALANVFVDVIPVTEHFQPLYRLPPTVVTPLASVTSLFVLLATYARRGAVAAARGRDRARRSATVSFATGRAALAVYLVGTVLVGSHLYGDTGHTTIGGDSKLVAGDLAFTCLYGGFFALHPHVPTVSDAGILPTARPKAPVNQGERNYRTRQKSRIYCNTGLSRRLCNTQLEQPSA
jgi:hypothetical protein